MLRCRYSVALVIALVAGFASRRATFAAPNQFLPMLGEPGQSADSSSAGLSPDSDEAPYADNLPPPDTWSGAQPFGDPSAGYSSAPAFAPEPYTPQSYLSNLRWLGLRHSSTSGRSAGPGIPLVGTSWLNRPYYVGGELGTLWITRSIYDDVTRDVDMIGGIYAGCDWDYYWGNELRFDWSTPELIDEQNRDVHRADSLFTWSYSLLYYPWGDARWRPYWRCGIGDTHVDFPLAGSRHDEWLLSFPFGVGVKYPLRRWLAARAEFTDHLSIDPDGDLNTLHNLSLTFALEWRFGAHPRSYWPWNPSRHIW